MNVRRFIPAFLVLACALALVAAYAFGVYVGRGQAKIGFDAVLASVQADLGLSKLQRLRELESDLSLGCSSEALAKVRFDEQTQLMVLASFYAEYKGTWVMERVRKRDPNVWNELSEFKQRQNSWTEPKCTK